MYDTSSIERMLISVVVREKNVEKTVQAILKSAYTGEIGDGRIFVSTDRGRGPYPYRREGRHSPFTMRKRKIISIITCNLNEKLMTSYIVSVFSKIGMMAAVVAASLFPTSLSAQDVAGAADAAELALAGETPVLDSGNTAWLIVATGFSAADEHSRNRVVLRRAGAPRKTY